MATTNEPIEKDLDRKLKLNPAAQKKALEFAQSCLQRHQLFSSFRDKMDAIDVAYARYKLSQAEKEATSTGVDTVAGATACNIFDQDDIVPPIVVSQVDSYVAYLAEVFLSGSPLFPVVSSPAKRQWAEKMEALMDDHATIGGYARQLLLFLRDGVKYNFCALEAEWDSIDQFSVLEDVTVSAGQRIKRTPKKFTRVTRLDPRNVVWDWTMSPGDISEQGDFAGYVKVMSRVKLKRLLNKWSKEGKAYNIDKAEASSFSTVAPGSVNYTTAPVISKYVQPDNSSGGWDRWFEPVAKKNGERSPMPGSMHEVFFLYARIMPADMGIDAPQPNTPQIWKFVIVNNKWVVYADRVISAYDYLPILFGQPLEDGLGYQTQSIAEGEIPFQEAANTLFNIRFAASRRAVSDRALYLPEMISPADINSKAAAPKIPVRISALSQRPIQEAYHQIPFDTRGTETTIQDAATIMQFSKELHGINGPKQGMFQKGNKSVQEWNDTMGGSDGRMRLPAITLEHQVFSPLKSIISLNILQYGEDGIVTSQATGRELEIKISELRSAALSFKICDGYSPKAKKASTEVLLAGMTMIGNSPYLQQQFGNRLPSMFLHFMSLSGVQNMHEYDPSYAENGIEPLPPMLEGNQLVNPGQGQPTQQVQQAPAQMIPPEAMSQPMANGPIA